MLLLFLGHLVKGAGIASGRQFNNVSATSQAPFPTEKAVLQYEEVLGNMFAFLVAGHETVANTIHCAFIYLALNWQSQSGLQRALEDVLGECETADWECESTLPKLLGGMAGAVMREVLRLVPPIVTIPKVTLAKSPQTLNFNGRTVVIPGDTLIHLVAPAVHRNPRYWATASDQSASNAERCSLGPIQARTLDYRAYLWFVEVG